MAIRRWDPLKDLLNLQERMNRLFEESLAGPLEGGVLERGGWTPPADVYETADAYVFQLELPGVLEGDVDVRCERGRLTVRGRRRAGVPVRPDCFHRMERSHGPFSRSFDLPPDAAGGDLVVQFGDGILQIVLPKGSSGQRGR